MIKAIVFDCFGVLYEDAFKQFVERYVAQNASRPRQYYYELALAADRGLVPTAEFYGKLSVLSGQDPATIRHHLRDPSSLNTDVVTIIEALRPAYQIGMLSNAERHFLNHFLASHHLERHFDVVVASSETPFIKPERGIFEEMARRLDVELPEIIFIDDSPANTAAAHNYGMRAITYQNPAQLRSQLPV